jgi:hypothetical protein
MNSTVLIALCLVVIIAATVFSVRNDPPFWMVLIIALVTYPISTALLDLSALSEAGEGFAGEWGVRLAVISLVSALLSLFVGKGKGKGKDKRASRTATGTAD